MKPRKSDYEYRARKHCGEGGRGGKPCRRILRKQVEWGNRLECGGRVGNEGWEEMVKGVRKRIVQLEGEKEEEEGVAEEDNVDVSEAESMIEESRALVNT